MYGNTNKIDSYLSLQICDPQDFYRPYSSLLWKEGEVTLYPFPRVALSLIRGYPCHVPEGVI
jgi:hypothetical protein